MISSRKMRFFRSDTLTHHEEWTPCETRRISDTCGIVRHVGRSMVRSTAGDIMVITTNKGSVGVVRAVAAGVAAMALGLACFEVPAGAQEAPSFEVRDFGVIPWPGVEMLLLRIQSVQEELKMTDAQKKEQESIIQRRSQKTQQARRDTKDADKFRAARDAILTESKAATEANLEPEQRKRLDEIQLQAQGPLAFDRPDSGSGRYAGPPVSERLKLSDDQVRRVRAIFEQGEKEIAKAASFPIALDTKNGPPSAETIHKLVESPEFQVSKQMARQAGRDASAALIRRIEEVLTDAQRKAYHKLLGEPFDLSKLQSRARPQRDVDFSMVEAALGLGGQRPDPSFDTKVARPAYASAQRRPRVLFDEAHHNYHTAGGRYKPLAGLITSDGYQIVPNHEKFSRELFRTGDILVIANAMGSERMGQDEAANPAFTDAECDAVRDWVKEGGALLLIADHAPFAAAAECLTKRFRVDISQGPTSDPGNSEGNNTSLVFSRQNHLLGDHPITRGRDDSERINRVQTFTGTSLKGPEGSIPILKLADTAMDHSPKDDKPVSAAGRAQGLALRFGDGRVVVMGEAAELSAQISGSQGGKFGMNVPGLDNRQMALNIMHWLSGVLDPG
jgi:hypothetical protein